MSKAKGPGFADVSTASFQDQAVGCKGSRHQGGSPRIQCIPPQIETQWVTSVVPISAKHSPKDAKTPDLDNGEAEPVRRISNNSEGLLRGAIAYSSSTVGTVQTAYPSPRASASGNIDPSADRHKLRSSVTQNFSQSKFYMAGFDIRAELTYQENQQILGERKLVITPPMGSKRGWVPTRKILGVGILKLTSCLYNFFTRREVAIFLQKLALLSAVMTCWAIPFESTCRLEWERRYISELKVFHLGMSLVYAVCSVGEFVSRFDVFLEEVGRKLRDATCLFSVCRSKLDTIVDTMGVFEANAAAESWNPVVSPLWLTLDMLALIGMVGEVMHLHDEPQGVPTRAMYVGLFNIFRLWRWLLPSPKRSPRTSTFWGSLLELFFSLALFTHIYACVFGLIATIEFYDHGKPTWADALLVVDEESEQRGCYDFYMSALYFSSYTVTSIGYGDIVPANTFEQGVDALGMIIAQMYLAKVFADLTFITAIHQHWQAEHHKKVTQSSAALNSMGMSGTLHDRVLAYQDFVWEVQKEQTAKEILEDLSPLLREEVKIILHHRLVIQAPFLQKLSIRALRCIVDSLTDCIYLPGDFIMRRGDVGNELFFLRDGCAAIFLAQRAPTWEDAELKLLRRGDYFGEVAVLTGAPRSSWVMARTYCVCSVLTRSAIEGVINTEPTCVSALARSMSKAMGLKREVSWTDLAERLDEEFEDVDHLYRFVCSGEDGEAPAGLVTWPRYQMLMHRLKIPMLDQKLLWLELDDEEMGEVNFDDVLNMLDKASREMNAGDSPQRSKGGCTEPESLDAPCPPGEAPNDVTSEPCSPRSPGCTVSESGSQKTSWTALRVPSSSTLSVRQTSSSTISVRQTQSESSVRKPNWTASPAAKNRGKKKRYSVEPPVANFKLPLILMQERVDELATQTEVQFSDLRSRIHDIARHLGLPSNPQLALGRSDEHQPGTPCSELEDLRTTTNSQHVVQASPVTSPTAKSKARSDVTSALTGT